MSAIHFRAAVIVVGVIVVGTMFGVGSAAVAAPVPAGPFTLNDADPEASIPGQAERDANPLEFGYLLQDLLDRAQAATKAQNFDASIRYYRALVKAVPDRAVAHARLCAVLESAGQREPALDACRSALSLPGVVVDDYTRYVRLVLAAPGLPSPRDVGDVNAVVAHLQAQPEARPVGFELQCQMGTRLHDTAMLEQCTAGLAAAAPDDAKTISYQWALALLTGDRAQALHLIDRAHAAGLGDGAVRVMREQMTAQVSRWPTRLADWRFSLALAIAVLAGTASILTIARRRRQQPQQLA